MAPDQEVKYRRAVAPNPWPEGINQRVVLTLRPQPEEVRYAVLVARTGSIAGATSRTRLEQAVGLCVAEYGSGWRLTLRSEAPRLKKNNPSSYDEISLLLAGLYAELVLEVSPAGELLGLVNPAAIEQRWQHVRQALMQKYPAPGEMLDLLVADVERALARPGGLWPSLRFTYLYAALLGDFYQQPLESHFLYTQPRTFPEFFDGLDLHFTETLRLMPSGTPEHAQLQLTGILDRKATNVAAIADLIRAALKLETPISLAEVQFTYEATHRLLRSTGLPAAVELTLRCAYQDQYYKEYYLTIEPEHPL